jgi:uncharacterized protein involved in cysteine biosynthesis
MPDEQFITIVLVVLSITLPVFFYKVILPMIESLYKLLMILVGTLCFWGATLGIYYLLYAIEADAILSLLLSLIAGAIASTPYYLVARIYTRLEKLELDAKYQYPGSTP